MWLQVLDGRGSRGDGGWTVSHYCDVIVGVMASQITSLTIVYSIIHSGADQRKHQSSASPAFVRGIHRWPVNSPHKWPNASIWLRHHDLLTICQKCPPRNIIANEMRRKSRIVLSKKETAERCLWVPCFVKVCCLHAFVRTRYTQVSKSS